MNTTNYEQGFIEKCAERGFDPVKLVKAAQLSGAQAGLAGAEMLPIISALIGAGHGAMSPPAGQTPILSGALEGAGAGLGSGIGAVGGGGLGLLAAALMGKKSPGIAPAVGAVGGGIGGGLLGSEAGRELMQLLQGTAKPSETGSGGHIPGDNGPGKEKGDDSGKEDVGNDTMGDE